MTNKPLSSLRLFLRSLVAMKRNFCLLAFDFGQWRSIKQRMAIDAGGIELPWYTYSALEYLSSFDFTNCEVFEFGSGNSSIFWADRAQSVCSVEDNQEWFEIVNKRLRENQIVIHRANEAGYIKSLSDQGKLFDVIVIDGNWRRQCTIEAIECLKDGGMIVLDNSDRVIEKECGKLLRAQGFLQIDFSGFGPINAYCWSTSVFIKTPTLLQQNFAGPNPIGGLNN